MKDLKEDKEEVKKAGYERLYLICVFMTIATILNFKPSKFMLALTVIIGIWIFGFLLISKWSKYFEKDVMFRELREILPSIKPDITAADIIEFIGAGFVVMMFLAYMVI